MWDSVVAAVTIAALVAILPIAPGPTASPTAAPLASPAAGAAASPGPAAQPGTAVDANGTPLKTIARVRSTTFCSDFATHANNAIASAVRNDATIGHTIVLLEGPNLDSNAIARHNEIASLSALSDQLYKDWKNGDQEVKRLRALADKTTDTSEKQDLKAFADWLGGALWRQRKIGRDLDGFVAYLNARDMMHIDESTAQANMGVYGVADPSTAHGIPGEFAQPTGPQTYPAPLSINYDASDTSQAEAAAKDFSQRVQSIVSDETEAAGAGDTAASHC
ncbi:MAG: hypothetical protein ACLQPV_08445 [Vulcanimicrobiaceae bacterium]